MAIFVAESVFIALFLESILYGIALTMTLTTMIVLSQTKSERQDSYWPLIFILSLMLVVATPHIILSFIRKLRAYVMLPGHGPSNFKDRFDPLLNAQNILLVVQTILGDCVNIWRCYIIYDRKVKYIVIPVVMMLASAVCGCLLINSYTHATALKAVFGPWFKAYEVLVITTNIYCTAAVSWKLHKAAQFRVSGSPIRSTFFVIAETGVLYTSSLIVCLGADIAEYAWLFAALDTIMPLVPCIFCFMILHSHVNRTSASPVVYALETPPSDDPAPSWMRMRRMLGKKRGIVISAALPVQIQISREEEEHYSSDDAIHTRKGSNDDASVEEKVLEIESRVKVQLT